MSGLQSKIFTVKNPGGGLTAFLDGGTNYFGELVIMKGGFV